MLDTLTQRLSKVIKTIRGEARLTENNISEALRQVRLSLLEADVALPVIKTFLDSVREKALGQDVLQSLTPTQAFVGIVNKELTQLMGEAQVDIQLNVVPPAVILMAGLQRQRLNDNHRKISRLSPARKTEKGTGRQQ